MRRFVDPCEALFETCRMADTLQYPFCSAEIARMMARRFDPSPNPGGCAACWGRPFVLVSGCGELPERGRHALYTAMVGVWPSRH